MSREDERQLGTADLAAGSQRSAQNPTFDPAADPNAPARFDEERPAGADTLRPHDPRGTAAFVSQDAPSQQGARQPGEAQALAALFQAETADDFRRRWDAIQIGFVDDPRAAVRNADELVAQVLRSLAESFAEQRSQTDARLEQGGHGSTEDMRVALQRYRSFFQRLLSL